MFLALLEKEYNELEEINDYILDFFIESFDGDVASLHEMFDLGEDEAAMICEELVKRVNAAGQVRKTLNRAMRARRASMTTGISKSQLKLRARKAARTKRKNPMIQRKALRKRAKALRRRRQLGLR